MTAEKPFTPSGVSIDALFAGSEGLTFKDINILPAFNPGITPENLRTEIARGFWLNIPLVSSPMDTVTEWKTAVHMALQGGLGVIHFNLTPEEAAEHVRRVKRYRMGFNLEPLCRKPTEAAAEVERVKEEHGFSTILITENGKPSGKLLGMVTKNHVDFVLPGVKAALKDVMTPIASLRVFGHGEVPTLESARKLFAADPALTKMPILKPDGSVFGLVTRKDAKMSGPCPLAVLDANEQLRVGAAVSTQANDLRRVELLIEAGADLIVIDSAHGGTKWMVERIKEIKALKPDLAVVAGNVVTAEQAAPLVRAGADGLRVGMGSGSICITNEQLGVGATQLSAIYDVSRAAAVPIIADGGIKGTNDICKALACGASTVMVGRFIAGCDETPGERVWRGQQLRKRYRGMGSVSAMREGGQRRYGEGAAIKPVVPQGIDGTVPTTGSLDTFLPDKMLAVEKTLEYLGCVSIAALHERVARGQVRFQRRTKAGEEEGAASPTIEQT